MEQIVKLPNQSMSTYLCHYLPSEDPTVSNDNNGDKTSVFTKQNETSTATAMTNTAPQPAQLNGATVITAELLDMLLYGKRKIQELDIEQAKRQKTKDLYDRTNANDSKVPIWCERCQSYHRHDVPCHEPLHILRHFVGNMVYDIKLTYAILSFPAEVQLCTSTIPGYKYGVCAKQPFPVGTWIGPYEGKRLLAEEVPIKSDSSYVWEIYEDGHFSHFLDGHDENTSSWMRFIRCARHKGEQNMVVFQYGTNIYYRAVRDIPAGVELLVWYNNNYTQFLGVPLGLPNVPGGKTAEGGETAKPEASSPMKHDEFKAFLKEQINKNRTKPKAQPQPNSYPTNSSTAGQPDGAVNASIPQTMYGQFDHTTQAMRGTTTNVPQVFYGPRSIPTVPQVMHGVPAPNSISQAIPGTSSANIPQMTHGAAAPNNISPATPTVPQLMHGAPAPTNTPPGIPVVPPMIHGAPAPTNIPHAVPGVTDNLPQSVNYARQMQTIPTYCYSDGIPAQQPMVFVSLNSVKPTVTIDHRPIMTEATSRSGSTVNTSYSVLPATNPPPSSTTPTDMLQQVLANPSDQTPSMKCNQCQQTFDQLSLFQTHMCCKSPDKPFECGHCSEAFATTSELHKHVLSHSHERPFKCGFCGSTFTTSATLSSHMQTHNVERAFRCLKCNKTFPIASLLSRHMRTSGECSNQYQSDIATPYTSTLTRG